MKIIVKDPDGPNIRLSIPTGLLLNRGTAGIAARYLRKHGVELSAKQIDILLRELNTYRHQNPNWVLVEVEGASGEYIKIRL